MANRLKTECERKIKRSGTAPRAVPKVADIYSTLDTVCQNIADIGKTDGISGEQRIRADAHLLAVAVVNIKYAVHAIEKATGIDDPLLTPDQRKAFAAPVIKESLGEFEGTGRGSASFLNMPVVDR